MCLALLGVDGSVAVGTFSPAPSIPSNSYVGIYDYVFRPYLTVCFEFRFHICTVIFTFMFTSTSTHILTFTLAYTFTSHSTYMCTAYSPSCCPYLQVYMPTPMRRCTCTCTFSSAFTATSSSTFTCTCTITFQLFCVGSVFKPLLPPFIITCLLSSTCTHKATLTSTPTLTSTCTCFILLVLLRSLFGAFYVYSYLNLFLLVHFYV